MALVWRISVNGWACRASTGELSADGAAGFDKGPMARTLACGSGWLLPAPVSPMWAIARVPLSNPDAALELSRFVVA